MDTENRRRGRGDLHQGNLDRPLITGMVYNGIDAPPFSPIDHPTQSGIKTRSLPNGTAKNFNMIRFEDKKGRKTC